MRTRLTISPQNDKKVSACKPIYLVACWARWGVRKYRWSGKYQKDTQEPLIWYYNDYNGCYEEYVLIPISLATTGDVLTWTFDEFVAEKIANAMNITDKI